MKKAITVVMADAPPSDERAAHRLSELCPPAALSYSFLLKAPGHSLPLFELRSLILNFPQVPDAADVDLFPDDFPDLCSDDLVLRDRLSTFIDFTAWDLGCVLCDETFSSKDDQVTLKVAPEFCYAETLCFLRQIFPNDDALRAAMTRNLTAFFHQFQPSFVGLPIPPVEDPRSCLRVSRRPSPTEALLLLFRYRQTDRITLQDFLDLRLTVAVEYDKESASIGHLIGDLKKAIATSTLFHVVHRVIVLRPPLIIYPPFVAEEWKYRPAKVPHIRLSQPEEVPRAPRRPRPRPECFDGCLEAFKKLCQKRRGFFTNAEVWEFVVARGPQGEPEDARREAIDFWIEKNAVPITIRKGRDKEKNARDMLGQKQPECDWLVKALAGTDWWGADVKEEPLPVWLKLLSPETPGQVVKPT